MKGTRIKWIQDRTDKQKRRAREDRRGGEPHYNERIKGSAYHPHDLEGLGDVRKVKEAGHNCRDE